MPLDPLVTAVVETGLNTLITQDADSQRRLQRLKGKVLRVRLTDINKTLNFVFSHQVDVLAYYEGEPDCELALPLTTAPELNDKSNLTRLIKEDKLELAGDIDVAQQFSGLLSGLDVDLAEWLSKYTGDVVAHTLVNGLKKSVGRIRSKAKQKQAYIADIVVEEWRLAPGALEITHFSDQVDDVRSQASRLEARLNSLIDAVDTL
ncbi:ubiquinone biosynthesis accessory factor UbiJ [Veronia pacifica]|uniref:Ubiquinone biosynthesis accessory factor UbiJ n=1 Tax=Veronia pacifica TaxID=1080227 RepID=A0A1C3EJK1_9GAMM|nr:SCP2 domain-containing protein [Veronia pacifica]ODA33408.1 hypothetical protein A8L45_10165 [Veronia pacifica]